MINEFFSANGLFMSRMISPSKSRYKSDNPHSVCIFNANIITFDEGKVWYGDLDLTKDAKVLKKIASEIGKTLYILKESDARFENEDKSGVELIPLAVWDTTQDTPFA